MASFLGIVASMLGAAFLRPAAGAACGDVMELLLDTGRATASNFDSPGHPAMSVSRAIAGIVDIRKVSLIR
jgi:hypothetical protein